MEQSRGRIISIADDQSHATVEVDSALSCARCASGKGCGAGVFGSGSGARRVEAPIVGRLELRKGDEVQIELAPESVLRAALVVYGLPLALALVASGLAFVLGLSDWNSVLTVTAGGALGVVIARRRLQQAQCLQRFTPAITRRLARAE